MIGLAHVVQLTSSIFLGASNNYRGYSCNRYKSIVGVIIVSLYMSIMGPAYRASIFSLSPQLIQQDLLSRYNALRMGVMQAGQLLGLGMSTLILALANKEIAFISLGIWFLLGGLMTFSLGKLPSLEKQYIPKCLTLLKHYLNGRSY